MAQTLRSLIVSVSAETSAYQREMQRAGRMGSSYLKSVTEGNRQATQAWRSQQAAIEAQTYALNNLRGAASGYLKMMAGALVTGSVLTMGDNWKQMASRIKMATSSQEEFIAVQEQLLAISDRTYKKYSDQATLFLNTKDTLKDLGYTTNDTLSFVEALMSGLVKGSASAQQTQTSIDSFSKALIDGALRGQNLLSVMNNAPEVFKAIAAGMNVTELELKKMAKAGELTTEKWLPALLSQASRLGAEVERMPTTIADAFTRASNHLAKFVSEQNDAVGASQAIVVIINTLSENMELLATAVMSVGAAYATLKVANLGKGLLDHIKLLREARGAEIGRARAMLDTAAMNARAAVGEVVFAEAQVKATAGTAGHAAALSALRKAKIANLEASLALTAAEKAHTSAVSVMGRAVKGALAIFGGPAGLALMVGTTAASMLLFSGNTDKAARSVTDFRRPIAELKKELLELNKIQAMSRQQDLLKDQAEAKQGNITNINKIIGASTNDGLFSSYGASVQERIKATDEFRRAIQAENADIGELTKKLIEQIQPTDAVKAEIIALSQSYADNADKIKISQQLINVLTGHLDELSNSANTAGASLKNIGVSEQQIKDAQTMLMGLQKQLIGINDKTGMEGLKFDLKAKGITEENPHYKEIIDTQNQIIKAKEEQAKLNQTAAGFAKVQNDIQKGYQKQLEQLNEQIALYGNTSQAAKMKYDLQHGELAALKAQEKQLLINKTIELDRLNAVKAYEDMMKGLLTKEEQAKATLKERLKILEDANVELAKQKDAIEKISKASISGAPKFGGVDASVGGASGELVKIAKAQQELDKWREQELKKQKEYLDEKLINEETYANRVLDIQRQNAQAQADLQQSWRSATLSMFASVTGDAADMLKELGGESSAAYKIMFAVSKAASIAQAIVNTELAATRAVAELGPVAGIPMAATVRALGYASVGMIGAQTIAGMAHSGMREVPYEGTWLLKGGERVLAPEQNQDLTKFLQDCSVSGGAGGNVIQPRVTVNVFSNNQTEVQSTQGYEQFGSKLAQYVRQLTRETIAQEKTQGGQLDPYSRRNS